MSVKSFSSTREVALREAPSISEHQSALGEQVGALRKRLAEFLSCELDSNGGAGLNALHKE